MCLRRCCRAARRQHRRKPWDTTCIVIRTPFKIPSITVPVGGCFPVAKGTKQAIIRSNAARKAHRTRLKRQLALARSKAARDAWRTMRGPVWKARQTARRSQDALSDWAKSSGFKVVFLDAASGNPRTGIADAILLRIRPKAADQIDLYVVQLKGGGAGFKATEMARLTKAASAIKATPLIVLHDPDKSNCISWEGSLALPVNREKRERNQFQSPTLSGRSDQWRRAL